jgi:hypothetical protein
MPGRPGHPSTGPVWPSRPVDPGYGVDIGGGHPAHPIAPPTSGPGSPSNPIVLPPEMWPPPGVVAPPIQVRPDAPPLYVLWVPGHGFKVVYIQGPPTQLPSPTPPVAAPKPA